MDKNGSGRIERCEVKEAIEELGLSIDAKKLWSMLRSGPKGLGMPRVVCEHCSHVREHVFAFAVHKYCSESNKVRTRRASTSSQIQKGGGGFGATPF